jgi:hypothetical protein
MRQMQARTGIIDQAQTLVSVPAHTGASDAGPTSDACQAGVSGTGQTGASVAGQKTDLSKIGVSDAGPHWRVSGLPKLAYQIQARTCVIDQAHLYQYRSTLVYQMQAQHQMQAQAGVSDAGHAGVSDAGHTGVSVTGPNLCIRCRPRRPHWRVRCRPKLAYQ